MKMQREKTIEEVKGREESRTKIQREDDRRN